MRYTLFVLLGIASFFLLMNALGLFYHGRQYSYEKNENNYWLLLVRNKNVEYLYRGIPGDATESTLVNTFQVKPGTNGESPTPLPTLIGKKYWTIIDKYSSQDNPETAPFFIELDVPGWGEEPFGPVPYEECNGQCYWRLPGEFGLHGVNGDLTRLSKENIGSSGCIRHTDEDIAYLYNIINIEDNVRYYVVDDLIPERFSRPLVTTSKSVSIPISSLALINIGE